MALEPERMTELSALFAARLAMVLPLVCLPPRTELTRFVLTERATEDAAFVTARCTVLRRFSASFSASRCAAASAFCFAFSAAASSRSLAFSAAASSYRRCFSAAASSAS